MRVTVIHIRGWIIVGMCPVGWHSSFDDKLAGGWKES